MSVNVSLHGAGEPRAYLVHPIAGVEVQVVAVTGQGIVLLTARLLGHQGEAVYEAGDGDPVRHEVGVDGALDEQTVHTAL